MTTRRALGKGLEALIPTRAATLESPPARAAAATTTVAATEFAPPAAAPLLVDIDKIRPNPNQPRVHFDEVKLQELADSVRENGILQPLLVTPSGDRFTLVAGERRLRAARIAGLSSVPVVVRDIEPNESLKLAILENVQREDLNPIEEARGYRRLIDDFGMTQLEIGERLGKSRASIANVLRLLQLSSEIQERIQTGELTAGHARALLGAASVEEQAELAGLVRERGLNVRQAEELARRKSSKRDDKPRNPALDELERRLEARFGTRVRLQSRKADGSAGRIEIDYYTTADLERIFETAGANYLL